MDNPLKNQAVRICNGENARTGIVVEVDRGAMIAKVALDHVDITEGGGTTIRSFRFDALTLLS